LSTRRLFNTTTRDLIMIPLVEQIEQTIKKQEQYLEELRQQLAEAVEESRPLHHRIACKLQTMYVKERGFDDRWEEEIDDNHHNWCGDRHQYWLVRADRLISLVNNDEWKWDMSNPFDIIALYEEVKKLCS
jgi:hypothetical protein